MSIRRELRTFTGTITNLSLKAGGLGGGKHEAEATIEGASQLGLPDPFVCPIEFRRGEAPMLGNKIVFTIHEEWD